VRVTEARTARGCGALRGRGGGDVTCESDGVDGRAWSPTLQENLKERFGGRTTKGFPMSLYASWPSRDCAEGQSREGVAQSRRERRRRSVEVRFEATPSRASRCSGAALKCGRPIRSIQLRLRTRVPISRLGVRQGGSPVRAGGRPCVIRCSRSRKARVTGQPAVRLRQLRGGARRGRVSPGEPLRAGASEPDPLVSR